MRILLLAPHLSVHRAAGFSKAELDVASLLTRECPGNA